MISLCMILFNEQLNKIEKILEQTREYVDEVVLILDKECSYDLEELCKKYIDRIYREEFIDFSQMKNKAIEYSSKDWILFLDPDEYLEPELLYSLKELTNQFQYDGYLIPRKNYEKDSSNNVYELAKYPDYQLRLFKRHCRYVGKVHETLIGGNNQKILDKHIIHNKLDEPIENIKRKDELYSRLEQEDLLTNLKLAYVSTYDTMCGMGIFTRHFLEVFPKRYQVMVFSEKDLVNVSRVPTLHNIPYIKSWCRIDNSFIGLFNEIMKYQSNIVHIHYDLQLFGADRRLIELVNNLKARNIKIIIEIQILLPQMIPFFKALNPDLIIVRDYPEQRGLLINSGLEHVEFIYHPIKIHRDISREEARKILGLPLNPFIILVPGFIRPTTGVGEIIEEFRKVLEKYSDSLLIFAGTSHPFDRDIIKLVRFELEKKGLGKKIIFTDRFHSEEELELLGSACDVFVIYRQSMNSITGAGLRAYSSCKPLISLEGIAVATFHKGCVKIKNKEQLSEEINNLIEDKEKYALLVRESRELREERNWVVQMIKYLKIYENLLRES